MFSMSWLEVQSIVEEPSAVCVRRAGLRCKSRSQIGRGRASLATSGLSRFRLSSCGSSRSSGPRPRRRTGFALPNDPSRTARGTRARGTVHGGRPRMRFAERPGFAVSSPSCPGKLTAKITLSAPIFRDEKGHFQKLSSQTNQKKNIDIFVDERLFLPHLFIMPKPIRVFAGPEEGPGPAWERKPGRATASARAMVCRQVNGTSVSKSHGRASVPGKGGVRLCPGHHRNTAARHRAVANAGAAALPAAARCRTSRHCSHRIPGLRRR